MKTWQIVALSIYEIVTFVLAVLFAPFVALFAKWDKEPTTFTGGAPNNGPAVIRGDLPRWLAWFDTFDERLPGGMYEQSMVATLNRFGHYVCSVRWLIRNRMFGLTKFLFAKPTTLYETLTYSKKFVGPLMFGAGWKRYRATPSAHWMTGPFIKLPGVTVRFRKNG